MKPLYYFIHCTSMCLFTTQEMYPPDVSSESSKLLSGQSDPMMSQMYKRSSKLATGDSGSVNFNSFPKQVSSSTYN